MGIKGKNLKKKGKEEKGKEIVVLSQKTLKKTINLHS
jgi:hypothetical protein